MQPDAAESQGFMAFGIPVHHKDSDLKSGLPHGNKGSNPLPSVSSEIVVANTNSNWSHTDRKLSGPVSDLLPHPPDL